MKPQRILIVDDEPGMLRTVERLLASEYRVATAGSARTALECASAFDPDLAVLDIRMPEMDGFALMGALREIRPDVDVIFMTGAVGELDGQLIRAIRERAFYFVQKPFDREVLLTLVERCLELRRLASENRAYLDRLEKELDDARSFQQGLLPPAAGTIGAFSIATRYQPCESLGGDFCDFVDAGQGRAAVLVADVSGHGVSAAMLTAIVKSAFHDARVEDYAPGAVLDRIERGLRPFDYDRFVTVFCGRASSTDDTFEYVNAGHPSAILWGPGRACTELDTTGPMVSPAFPEITWETARVELAAGDRLLAYTDGIVEQRGPEGLFGEQRLLALLGPRAHGAELLDGIVDAVQGFSSGRPADDDLTLLTVAVGE